MKAGEKKKKNFMSVPDEQRNQHETKSTQRPEANSEDIVVLPTSQLKDKRRQGKKREGTEKKKGP